MTHSDNAPLAHDSMTCMISSTKYPYRAIRSLQSVGGGVQERCLSVAVGRQERRPGVVGGRQERRPGVVGRRHERSPGVGARTRIPRLT